MLDIKFEISHKHSAHPDYRHKTDLVPLSKKLVTIE